MRAGRIIARAGCRGAVNIIGPWDAMVVIAKAVSYAATLGAAGGAAFLVYSDSLLGGAAARRIRRVVTAMAGLAALAGAAKILATANSMSGDFTGMLDPEFDTMILETGEGWAIGMRCLGLVLMAACLAMARRPHPIAILGAVAAATSFAWVGHTHRLPAPTLPVVCLAVHLLGVAFWLGALIPLYLITRDADVAAVAAATARFGKAALAVVALLVAAGTVLLCSLLHRFAELWTADYGRLLLCKLGVVACLLALAAVNRWALTPRLLARDARAVRTLRRSLLIEMLLGVVILTLTAALTTLTGP